MNLNQQSFEAGMAGGDSLSFKANRRDVDLAEANLIREVFGG